MFREEVWTSAAFVEVCGVRGVEDFLDVGAVEVIIGAAGERGKADFVVQIRAVFDKVVDVEAGVCVVDCGVDVVVEITAWERGVRWSGDWSRWWERGGVLVEEISVPA